jgi:phosphoribosylglycinamide formyltransferase 1
MLFDSLLDNLCLDFWVRKVYYAVQSASYIMNKSNSINISVLGSGSGTNFQAIADAVIKKQLNANIAAVFSDVPDAYILERARALDIPAEYIDHSPYITKLAGRAEYEMIQRLQFYNTQLVVLAGYIRMIKKQMLKAFKKRIINIHPSLLPAFRGLDAWKQALKYGVKITGCTVHFIDDNMDTGPIILQKAVPVYETDTPESLHKRIQEQEHIAYVEAIKKVIKEEF